MFWVLCGSRYCAVSNWRIPSSPVAVNQKSCTTTNNTSLFTPPLLHFQRITSLPCVVSVSALRPPILPLYNNWRVVKVGLSCSSGICLTISESDINVVQTVVRVLLADGEGNLPSFGIWTPTGGWWQLFGCMYIFFQHKGGLGKLVLCPSVLFLRALTVLTHKCCKETHPICLC